MQKNTSSEINPAREKMCCVCRTRKPIDFLVRVSRENGEYSIGVKNGRGCHVCISCIEKCVKTRALNRSFKTNVPQEIYDTLLKG